MGSDLLDKEQDDLITELINIPRRASDHRVKTIIFAATGSYHIIQSFYSFLSNGMNGLQINGFMKRAKAAKIHAYIISHLKKEMPALMGKAKAQERLVDNLEEEFVKVAKFLFMDVNVCIAVLQRLYNYSERWTAQNTDPEGIASPTLQLPRCGSLQRGVEWVQTGSV